MATSESIAADRWFGKLGDGDQDDEELHPEGVVRLLLDDGQELGLCVEILQGVVQVISLGETDHFSHWGVSSKVSIINRPFRLQPCN